MSIKIYNLHTSKFEDEKVCAEKFMRFLYGNPLGGALTHTIFKRAFFSRLCGKWADSPRSAKAAAKFIADNSIDIEQFAVSPSTFKNFNDFFTRALKPEARPISDATNQNVVSFPSDGRHLLVKNVGAADEFYAKGKKFNLEKFLGDAALAKRFENATLLISRLSPLDYHRFHYPFGGEIVARKQINGSLFSVSPIALAPRLSIFWENKRILNLIESDVFGLCAFVEIGATNVGSIVNISALGDRVSRGETAGYFKFGGSCVVTVFPSSDKIIWNAELEQMSARGVECYARVNSTAGILK